MTDLKLSLDIISGSFAHRMNAAGKLMAQGMTAAMDNALDVVKTQARASIARAGFSKRWQNTLRADRYPRPPNVSITPGGHIYHKIPYAGVFEEGARIQGSPLMWLALPTAPQRIGSERISVSGYIKATGQRLLKTVSRKGTPILSAVARVSGTVARQPHPKVSLATLRKGASAVSPSGGKRRGKVMAIPLFVGIRSTDIEKKFAVTEAVDAARKALPAAYAAELAKRITD